jgi:hypothetical protein
MEVVRLRRESGKIVQDCDIYIGRACYRGGWSLPQSIWHNPFSVKQYGRDNAVNMYEAYVRGNTELMLRLDELKGKRLGCWCEPGEKCHGKILIKLLNEKNGIVTLNLDRKEKEKVKILLVEKPSPSTDNYINVSGTVKLKILPPSN